MCIPTMPPWHVTGQPLCCSYLPHTGDTEFEINMVIMKYVLDLHPYFGFELIRCVNYVGGYDFFKVLIALKGSQKQEFGISAKVDIQYSC